MCVSSALTLKIKLFFCILGYARNLLIPRKLAIYATVENREQQKATLNNVKIWSKHGSRLTDLASEKLVFERLAAPGTIFAFLSSFRTEPAVDFQFPGGALFGAVTGIDLAFEMNRLNIAVFPSEVNMKETIKKPGVYTVEIDSIPITFEVVPKFL